MRSVRRTVASTEPTPATCCTGPMRAAIATASTGRDAPCPNSPWPAVTSSRFVPSRSSAETQVGLARLGDPEHRDHGGDPDRDPERRERRAQTARVQADRADAQDVRGQQPAWCELHAVRPPGRARSGRRASRRGAAAEAAISRSCVISRTVVPSAFSSCRSSRMPAPDCESRLPVGSSANTIVGRPTTARAIATRWRSPPESWLGWCVEPVRETDSVERLAGELRGGVRAGRPCRAGRWRRCRAPTCRR